MLFTNNIFATAFDRDPESNPRPFYLYIDEVQNYVSDDIEEILSQAAKFGLYLTLSHQTLGHLAKAGEHIYKGVMSGTLLKAVFQIPFEEALVFADELFADEVDFEKIKENVRTPHMVGHRSVMVPTYSYTTGGGSTDVDSKGEADSLGEADTHANVIWYKRQLL